MFGNKQESHAVARKPRDGAAVLFGSPTTFTTSLRVITLRKPGLRAPNISAGAKQFNAKLPFKVIQGHVFWSQWKGDKGVSNTTCIAL